MALSVRSGSASGAVCSDMGVSIVGRIMTWSYSYCNRCPIILWACAKRKQTPFRPRTRCFRL